MDTKISTLINTRFNKDYGVEIADAHWGENDIEVELYTGLKDINGKEVFEGDILHNFIDIKVIVVFKDGEFKMDGMDGTNEFWHIRHCSHFEIIGNIHENAGLLKQSEEK